MQQISSLRSNPMTANLSFGLILAFSRMSFGRTICPLASTETTASILQHSLLQYSLLVILGSLERVISEIIYTFLKNQNYLTITTGQDAK